MTRRRPGRLATPGFERTRRGAHTVLVCLGRRAYPGHEGEPCPYTIVVASPGVESVETEAARVADKHRTTWHGGMTDDIAAQAIKGQLETTGEIGR